MSKPIPKGQEFTGDIRETLDSRFLNAMVLETALERISKDSLAVTIDRIEFHKVLKYENGQTNENAYLLYFVGSDKPLKLNVSHKKTIMAIHGAMGADWHGKKISLCIENAYRPDLNAKGPCVRVKPEAPKTSAKAKGGEQWKA